MKAFLFAFNAVLVFRFAVFFHDEKLSKRSASIGGVLIAIALGVVFQPSWALAALIAGILFSIVVSWFSDRRSPRPAARLAVLLLQVTVIGLATSEVLGIAFRPGVRDGLETLSRSFVPFAVLIPLFGLLGQAYLAGLLLCMQEANLAVRWLIELLRLKPADPGEPGGGSAEYNRGRVIGMLERIAVYCLVLLGEYEALGLVMAAKGLARFNNLDDRNFAEYFLIGTFLSAILAGAIALSVRSVF